MTNQNESSRKMSIYTEMVDNEIERIFTEAPKYNLYQHLAYFMGFRNEKLEPVRINAGKRFRSGLALLLAEFYNNVEQTLPTAVSIELFHNFTLVHDDLVDGDTMRRGRPTVWKLFGTDHAINDGDAQLIMSLEVIMSSDKLSAVQKVSLQNFILKQYRRVVEGQFLDFSMAEANLGDPNVSEALYLDMIGRKTSDLIAVSTTVSGLTGGVDVAEQKILHDYGHQLGLVYQICDDVISIWGKSNQTGKRECGDIIERKKTLPILWWYENSSLENRERMKNLYNKEGEMPEETIDEILNLLDSLDTYEVMMKRIKEEATKADQLINKLPFSIEQKQVLLDIVEVLQVDIKAV